MTLPILGRSHALVRRIRSLRRERAIRDRERVFLAEGLHLADEALRADVDVERAFVSPRLTGKDGGREILDRAIAAGWELHEVADTVLDSLQEARTPQPILTLVRRDEATLPATLERIAGRDSHPLLVVAHGIQDPGNLGSLVRTADASGADAFVTCGNGADLYHPRAVRASAGSIFRIPLHHADVETLVALLETAEINTVATVPGEGTDYTDVAVDESLALFVGAEGAGLPHPLLDQMDRRIRIPMRDGVDSLSVGAAAAVVLFDIARRRRS